VVFGMPAEAIARGGATHVATLLSMPDLIGEAFKKRPAVRAATRTA
jgi:chemotaxis response regulator CheB